MFLNIIRQRGIAEDILRTRAWEIAHKIEGTFNGIKNEA